jgi:hypothetical protein
VEVTVDKSGMVSVNGWAALDALDYLLTQDPLA